MHTKFKLQNENLKPRSWLVSTSHKALRKSEARSPGPLFPVGFSEACRARPPQTCKQRSQSNAHDGEAASEGLHPVASRCDTLQAARPARRQPPRRSRGPAAASTTRRGRPRTPRGGALLLSSSRFPARRPLATVRAPLHDKLVGSPPEPPSSTCECASGAVLCVLALRLPLDSLTLRPCTARSSVPMRRDAQPGLARSMALGLPQRTHTQRCTLTSHGDTLPGGALELQSATNAVCTSARAPLQCAETSSFRQQPVSLVGGGGNASLDIRQWFKL